MFVGSDKVQYKGQLAVPGMILRLASDPSMSKEGGTVQGVFDAYASLENYRNKKVLHKRYLSVTLVDDEQRAEQMNGPRGIEEKSVAYHCPDVVRCWGGTPENSVISEENWPNNLWAQFQFLCGMTKELEEFASDEQKIETGVRAAVAEVSARKAAKSAT